MTLISFIHKINTIQATIFLVLHKPSTIPRLHHKQNTQSTPPIHSLFFSLFHNPKSSPLKKKSSRSRRRRASRRAKYPSNSVKILFARDYDCGSSTLSLSLSLPHAHAHKQKAKHTRARESGKSLHAAGKNGGAVCSLVARARSLPGTDGAGAATPPPPSSPTTPPPVAAASLRYCLLLSLISV